MVKWLRSTLLEDVLWGIDDPAVVARIRRTCLRRIATRLTGTDVLVLSAFLVLSLAAAALPDLLACHRWERFVMSGGILGGGLFVLFRRIRRRVAEMLPGILESMQRCVRCGYQLDDESSGACPECGHRAQLRS